MKKKYKVTVVGSGYVGMSISVLLAQLCDVIVHDINKERVDDINNKRSTIRDDQIEHFLNNNELSLTASYRKKESYKDSDFIVLAVPTNFDEITKHFDTSILDEVISDIKKINKTACLIIKSTVPVGYTSKVCESYKTDNIVFSPEFLREGNALKDNLEPSRIIIGSNIKPARIFASLLLEASKKYDTKVLFMSAKEAESVKLFSNTYLAMRVSFFNELDTFAHDNNLNTKDIIDGVCLDSRIGANYNNPSFGYGGYCLPKDTKQLLSNFQDTPQNIISAIVDSNESRKKYLVEKIMQFNPKTVGLYRIVMKKGSDNYRFSAVIDILKLLKIYEIDIIIYEPSYREELFEGIKVEKDLEIFKYTSDIILANRNDSELIKIKNKIFTRDIFGDN
jgi:UDPglucose 6-dehydrogenase